jgi:CRISPR-associated Csx2 family protein
MAKVLISFLGTNDYIPCNYYLDKDRSLKIDNLRFIQEALLKLLCTGWDSEDRIIVFLTEDAEKKNWIDTVYKTGESKPGLDTVLKSMKLKPRILSPRIKEGYSESDIWDIFETVFSQLNDNDELILDITHSFRSIPMLGLVLLNYARVLKNITVKGIYYGAFEKLGPSYFVKENISISERNAPIVDVTSLMELQDWTTAINSFIKSGDASMITGLTSENVNPVSKATQGKDPVAGRLKSFAKNIERITDYYRYCRGGDIRSFDFDSFNENLQLLAEERNIFIKPLPPLFSLIKNQFENSSTGDSVNLIHGAQWCLDHGWFSRL